MLRQDHNDLRFVQPEVQEAGEGRSTANAVLSPFPDPPDPDPFKADALTIALIGPDPALCKAAADAFQECNAGILHEFPLYPAKLEDVPRLHEHPYDIVLIDLDSDPESALALVEQIGTDRQSTVMVFSSTSNSDLLVRCMRAGARELLRTPFDRNTIAEALVRAAARRRPSAVPRKAPGKLLVFMGAKGGAGVTTIACNFAVALAQDSGQRTLLIDLDLPLGDAALNLGINAEYSTIHALQNAARLDASFLSKLIVKHDSGMFVLAAPGKFPQFHGSNEAINKLMAVARQSFDNVVVDVGSRLDLTGTALFTDAFTVYLVTQAGIPELRNSNRLVTEFFTASGPRLEIVVNRYESHAMGVTDEHIAKALTRPIQWKIPNNYAAVRRMQNTATPLSLEDSPISRRIRQMTRSLTGEIEKPQVKKGFSIFK